MMNHKSLANSLNISTRTLENHRKALEARYSTTLAHKQGRETVYPATSISLIRDSVTGQQLPETFEGLEVIIPTVEPMDNPYLPSANTGSSLALNTRSDMAYSRFSEPSALTFELPQVDFTQLDSDISRMMGDLQAVREVNKTIQAQQSKDRAAYLAKQRIAEHVQAELMAEQAIAQLSLGKA